MKTEQLIVRYLYSNKKVSLQDIGTFTLAPEISVPTENDKDTALPPDSIRFVYDPKTLPDEGLVAYIMEHTRKIKPLATSDLESYSILNKQFLNIGKPLILEGIGTLQKTQKDDYAFTQSSTSHVIFEEAPKLVTEKQKEKVSFATPPRDKSDGGGKAALLIIALLLIGCAAFAVYYFMYMREKPPTEVATGSVVTSELSDSAGSQNSSADSSAALASSLLPAVKDTNTFYVVIKEYTTAAAAEKGFSRISAYGHKVFLSTKDSSSFKLRMPFIVPLSDTLRIKDSLAKFFSARTYVELP